MAYKISNECIGCGACEGGCPTNAISCSGDKYDIDSEKCIDCGSCAGVCPVGAPEKAEEAAGTPKKAEKAKEDKTTVANQKIEAKDVKKDTK